MSPRKRVENEKMCYPVIHLDVYVYNKACKNLELYHSSDRKLVILIILFYVFNPLLFISSSTDWKNSSFVFVFLIRRKKRSIKSFLCRAAINLGIDRQRRETKEARLFSGSEREALCVASSRPAPDQALEIEARLAALREAIAELPERRRLVFILHRLHGLTPDQICVRLNISRNMVDRHLRRAFAHCLDRIL